MVFAVNSALADEKIPLYAGLCNVSCMPSKEAQLRRHDASTMEQGEARMVRSPKSNKEASKLTEEAWACRAAGAYHTADTIWRLSHCKCVHRFSARTVQYAVKSVDL